jgi:hypothetical protein
MVLLAELELRLEKLNAGGTPAAVAAEVVEFLLWLEPRLTLIAGPVAERLAREKFLHPWLERELQRNMKNTLKEDSLPLVTALLAAGWRGDKSTMGALLNAALLGRHEAFVMAHLDVFAGIEIDNSWKTFCSPSVLKLHERGSRFKRSLESFLNPEQDFNLEPDEMLVFYQILAKYYLPSTELQGRLAKIIKVRLREIITGKIGESLSWDEWGRKYGMDQKWLVDLHSACRVFSVPLLYAVAALRCRDLFPPEEWPRVGWFSLEGALGAADFAPVRRGDEGKFRIAASVLSITEFHLFVSILANGSQRSNAADEILNCYYDGTPRLAPLALSCAALGITRFGREYEDAVDAVSVLLMALPRPILSCSARDYPKLAYLLPERPTPLDRLGSAERLQAAPRDIALLVASYVCDRDALPAARVVWGLAKVDVWEP